VVLKYLERTADLHFDIQGRTVIVRGKPHSRYHLNY
jgi:transmembrane sensor